MNGGERAGKAMGVAGGMVGGTAGGRQERERGGGGGLKESDSSIRPHGRRAVEGGRGNTGSGGGNDGGRGKQGGGSMTRTGDTAGSRYCTVVGAFRPTCHAAKTPGGMSIAGGWIFSQYHN